MSTSIAEAILEATKALRGAGLSEPRREAGSLLANVLARDQTFLITHAEILLTAEEVAAFRRHIDRRAGREPLQYIIGSQEFFGLEFDVNRDALIPRPETELLVETALDLIDSASAAPLICDVGTGTGCIAISLLHERPRARAIALDISPLAARLATQNAARHQIGERIAFVVADCLAAFRIKPRFDLIVSNPPYIADRDWADLQLEVREHEPRVALTSGSDGLLMIRRLLKEAPALLVDGGHLVIEIGYDQRVAVEEMIDARIWNLLGIRNDLQGIPRTVVLRLNRLRRR
jgi:release factor glutamine methyltransferase